MERAASPRGRKRSVFQRLLDLSIRVKLGALVAVSLIALLVSVGVAAANNRSTANAEAAQSRLDAASALVLQLDRVASDLKVNGLQAVIRDDPRSQPARLEQRVGEATGLVRKLGAIKLPPRESRSVQRIRTVVDDYVATITRYVGSAALDQAQARHSWARIDVDNYLVSTVIANERAQFLQSVAESAKATADDRAAGQRIQWITFALTVLIVTVVSWFVVNSIIRSLLSVRAVLDAMASGDLTRGVEVRSADEVGEMARALNAAQEDMRSVVASVVRSIGALSGTAEGIADTSDSVAASAQQTSAQAQAVSIAAGQVSASVNVVAKGSEEIGESIRAIALSAQEAVKIVEHAVGIADAATTQIAKLGESSAQ